MICPHCRTAFHDSTERVLIGVDVDAGWAVDKRTCAACRRLVLTLESGVAARSPHGNFVGLNNSASSTLVRPRGAMRPACPPSVPKDIASDYAEACLVAADSPKASAAPSRRCLQSLLRSAAGAKAGDLANEIQQVLDAGKLPSYLSEAIDAVRNIGNFAAHPMKAQATGVVLDVEPGEAEWNLDVLEQLFDFYYVQPAALLALRRAHSRTGRPQLIRGVRQTYGMTGYGMRLGRLA